MEFPLESHNAEGLFIAGEVAQCLDDSWIVKFTPLERKNYFHVSWLCDRYNCLYNAQPRLTHWGDGTPIAAEAAVADDAFLGRWVRFMFDHCSSCLWDAAGSEGSLDELPVDPSTAEALGAEIDALRIAWEDWDFEDSMRPKYTPDYLARRLEFAEAGLAIARKIKAALPDDWTVAYVDIERAARRGIRSAFEYRV